MTICPVALAVGCKRCPVFSICPAKSIIGDQAPDAAAVDPPPARARVAKHKARRKSKQR